MLFVTANGGGFHGEKQTQKGSEDGLAGLPEDIGGTVASLLADDNLWINGQRIEASGGMLL
jgi:NAD(P)-dependent dehydrogenase (short-subunit alcohol dehydrogenase family)